MDHRNGPGIRPRPAERDDRRRKVEYLLIAGATTNKIAAAVGVNRKTVLLDAKAIRAEWGRARVEAYDRYAAEELVRLAKLQEAVWTDAMAGNIKAVGVALRISDQRCRMLGLYAPLHLDVQDDRLQSREDFDREVREHLARLDAADAAAVEAEARAIVTGERLNGDGRASATEKGES
jgi:hypothetical protein